MNKKGFTLAELLVVIAIIAVVSIIAIPSVVTVNKKIKERTYSSKVDFIKSAAEVYAEQNPDIFNGENQVKVYVYELIKENLLEVDKVASNTDNSCKSTITIDGVVVQNASGCYIDPRDKTSMNDKYVILTKEAVGITAEFGGTASRTSTDDDLVDEICNRFENPTQGFIGKYGEGANDTCTCDIAKGLVATGGSKNGQALSACIISGNVKNNYLEYDGVMWRVMGLYDIYGSTSSESPRNRLVVKMITNDNLDVK